MPGVTRKDVDSAGGFLAQGSSDVTVNGRGAVRLGDAVRPHGRSKHARSVMIQGLNSVTCNNRPIVRAGDLASCGHKATGSSDVTAGR